MNTHQQIIDALVAACGICTSDTCKQIMGTHMNQIDLALLTGAVGVFGQLLAQLLAHLLHGISIENMMNKSKNGMFFAVLSPTDIS